MKITTLVLALLSLFATSGWCRVGETYDEIVKRFGKPHQCEKDAPRQECYFDSPSGFVVHIVFLQGRSSTECYYREGGKDGQLSRADVETILGANSRGKRWDALETLDAFGERFHRSDTVLDIWRLEGGSLFAVLLNEHQYLIAMRLHVFSQEAIDVWAEEHKAKRDKAIKDSGL